MCRYGLQIVYYTKEKGLANSKRDGPKRPYNAAHGAIFQAPCADNVSVASGRRRSLPVPPENKALRSFCEKVPSTSMALACECDFRSS